MVDPLNFPKDIQKLLEYELSISIIKGINIIIHIKKTYPLHENLDYIKKLNELVKLVSITNSYVKNELNVSFIIKRQKDYLHVLPKLNEVILNKLNNCYNRRPWDTNINPIYKHFNLPEPPLKYTSYFKGV